MSDFDRIATSRPVTRTAAMVTARGVHWTPEITPTSDVWQPTPLPVVPAPRGLTTNTGGKPIPPGFAAGRLTVLGYGGRGGHAGRWVVRCSCGMYGYRRAKALRGSDAGRLMCPACHYLEQMKLGEKPSPAERKALREGRAARKAAAKAPAPPAKLGDVIGAALTAFCQAAR